MRRSAGRRTGRQQAILDDLDPGTCSSSPSSGSGFKELDDAKFAGAHRSSSATMAHLSTPGAGETKLTTFVRSEDDDDESGVPPTAHSATVPDQRLPSADRKEFAVSRTPARQRTLSGRWSANALRSPGNRRSIRTLAEESSESEAEAIAERHSKWVTFGKPCVLPAALMTTPLENEQGGCSEKSGSLKDTATPCLGLADDGAREGSELEQLSDERSEPLLDISDLIEATSAQLERAGNSESCWTPLNLGKDQPRQVPLEEKVAAWDPCQEDSYALSPPGELELFELDVFYPRRPARPAAATRRIRTRSSAHSSSRMSTPVSPQRFKKPLSARPPAANMYEDLRWIVESSEKSAGPSFPAERVPSADVDTASAQPQPSISPTPAASAQWHSHEAFAPIGKPPSVVLRATSPSNSRPRNEAHRSTALHLVNKDSPEDVPSGFPGHEGSSPAPPPPDGFGKRNRTPAVASPVEATPGPVRSGTQQDEAKEGVVRSREPAEQEPTAQEEKHHRHRRDMRRRKLKKLKKKERALSARSARSEASAVLSPVRHSGRSEEATPRDRPLSASSRRGANVDGESGNTGNEETHLDSGTVSIRIKTSMPTRSSMVWPFDTSRDT
ncbi:uncharacterized protein LOC119440725 [Dermacentor silvarum]|uniref:uncharacterized protein LOC119440725 n=1 Tax=Dermacentor silvarum TaxID=543639 RepID=UPI001897ED0C|nr:uncharacterized protein LOC119440725 [Dermacentor silvarum]